MFFFNKKKKLLLLFKLQINKNFVNPLIFFLFLNKLNLHITFFYIYRIKIKQNTKNKKTLNWNDIEIC